MALITWKRDTAQYANGYIGLLNKKLQIFYISWDCCSQRESKWKMSTRLPGLTIKDAGKYFMKSEDAQKKAEEYLKYWLNAAGLQRKLKRIEK